jgi:hypothetical protein
LKTGEILVKTGIAPSTWSSEQSKLVMMKLIDKHIVRTIANGFISRRMNYSLTEKGALVALNLRNISEILNKDSTEFSSHLKDQDAGPENTSVVANPQVNQELKKIVNECVEIGLDSFGLNLANLIKRAMEIEYGIQWEELSENTLEFKLVLTDYFGFEASKKIEKIIAANLRSHFPLDEIKTDDLSKLIPETSRRSLRASSSPNPKLFAKFEKE